MSTSIKFGTDGWRAIIAEDFTFDNVRACAQGVADYLKENSLDSHGIVVGYDTRFASEDFAAAVSEVLAANGIKVYLCPKATPTPVVSYGILATKAGGGILITASHNPAQWNGFKYKTSEGTSASDQVTAELEKCITHALSRGEARRVPLANGLSEGLIQYLDLAPLYSDHLTQLVNLEALRQAELKVVADSMFGAGAGYFKRLLGGGRMELTEINSERNPLFPGIRPEPIAVNLTKLSTMVKEQNAAVGLATDGDADRIGVVDEKGAFLTPLQVFPLLCLYFLEVRGERGAIVKSLTASTMLSCLGELFDVPVYETPVGFKYIAPIMIAKDALIGGEESGGYGFRGHVPERDGILAGIYFLDLMVRTGKTPSQLLEHLYSKVGPHHYQRLDCTFPPSERQAITERMKHFSLDFIEGSKVARRDTIDGFRFLLEDGSWLLIRFSGTEPVLRIYAESASQVRTAKLLEAAKRLIGI